MLVSRLRGMVDELIGKKIDNPRLDLKENEVVKVVAKLIQFDGLDA